MSTKDFVSNWKAEKENYLCNLFAGDTGLSAQQLAGMKLSEEQTHQMWRLLDAISTDLLYTVLLGLDGSATIGNGAQQSYRVQDEDGNLVFESGDLEAEAFEQFHGNVTDLAALQKRAAVLRREVLKNKPIHDVRDVTVGASGITRCAHCGVSFDTNSRSWDGEKHSSCGKYLRLQRAPDGITCC